MKAKAVLCAMLFLMSEAARAVDIEIGTGATHYKTAHDGLWYQEAYPHTFDLNDTSLSLGISKEINGLRYRAEYLYLGWLYNSAQWTSDSTYYAGSTAPTTAYGLGRGSASGVLLSVSRPVVFGIYAEVGAWVYMPKWKISVYNFADGSHLCECETPPTWKVGPGLGIGIRHNGLDISVKYLGMPTTGTDTPPLYNHAYVMEMRVYF